MSFGTSVGDIILLIQLAHKNYRNCKEAGGEYIEIAREVRSLHSVLRTVRDEAERKDSLIFKSGPEKTKELTEIADGCKGVLEGIDALLAKYKGLAPDSADVGKATKVWQKLRFGTEIEDLGKLRWKIITYTSTLAVLVDSINLKATERVGDVADRIESRMETGFAEMSDRLERFEDMRKAVLFIATRARASQRYLAMDSVLSLSTYADDDKEVWRQFRSQLVSLGFKSDSLDRHMEVLKAYMMKLDQTGLLDEATEQSDASTLSWCGNASFRTTNLSLLGTAEMAQHAADTQAEESYSQEKSMSIVDERYDDVVTPSSLPPSDKPMTRRRRVPRIKVEQSDHATDSTVSRASKNTSPVTTPVETDDNGASNANDARPGPETEIDSGIDVSRPRQPRPYVESYYSISEAAANQSTLIRNTSEYPILSTVSKEPRPQTNIRPTSWSGPESRKSSRRYQQAMRKDDNGSDSDSTIGNSASRTVPRKNDRSPISSEKKVGDWLNLPNQETQTRASSSPTRQKPKARSTEDVPSGEGNKPERRSSATSSQKRAKSDPRSHFESRPAEEIFEEFMREGKKAEERRSSPGSKRNVKFEPTKSFESRPAEDIFAEFMEGEKHKDRRSSPSSRPADQSTFSKGLKHGFYDRRPTRSRSPTTPLDGEDGSSSQTQQAAKAALIAGAVEAFRARNEEGSWTGDKGMRILTAAIGAAGVGATMKADAQKEGKEVSENERERRRKLFSNDIVEIMSADSESDPDMDGSDREIDDHVRREGSRENKTSQEKAQGKLQGSERVREYQSSRRKPQVRQRNSEWDEEDQYKRKKAPGTRRAPVRDQEDQRNRRESQRQPRRPERVQEDSRSSTMERNSGLLAAVLGGLAANRLMQNRRQMKDDRQGTGGSFVASDSEYDSESESASDTEGDSDVEKYTRKAKRRTSPPPQQQQQHQQYQQAPYQQQQQPLQKAARQGQTNLGAWGTPKTK